MAPKGQKNLGPLMELSMRRRAGDKPKRRDTFQNMSTAPLPGKDGSEHCQHVNTDHI